jgi:hypothetical protein
MVCKSSLIVPMDVYIFGSDLDMLEAKGSDSHPVEGKRKKEATSKKAKLDILLC